MTTIFTPTAAILGGSLIGLASVLLMLMHGRIAGMTGILSGAFLSKGDRDWRIAFLIGAILSPSVYFLMTGQPMEFSSSASQWALIVGGLVVGVGVFYGSGCTSGHGICGVSRLSPRSLVATAAFMASTTLTVFITRHII